MKKKGKKRKRLHTRVEIEAIEEKTQRTVYFVDTIVTTQTKIDKLVRCGKKSADQYRRFEKRGGYTRMGRRGRYIPRYTEATVEIRLTVIITHDYVKPA